MHVAAPVKPGPPGPLAGRAIALALPREHGSWSLALEPMVLGLVAAPSAAGALLGTAVLAAFFLRRPARLMLTATDDPRWRLACGCVAVLGAAALAAVGWAGVLAGGQRLWPLVLAVPAGAAFAWWDSRGEGREAAAELAGAVAFAAVPASLAALAGWPPGPALALAAFMAARSVPTVMTLRAYLRRNKGQAVRVAPALGASVGAAAGTGLLAAWSLAPWAAVLAASLLAVRAVVLLTWPGLRVRATLLGIAEATFGGILVLVVALSWSR